MATSGSTLLPVHFGWAVNGPIGTITLNRPERKNPLTFESYRELTAHLGALSRVEDVRAVVITGAGGNFSSGGDVHEIIGPLVQARKGSRTSELLRFTTMTGDLVRVMRACPQPIISAIDGVCAGAGAIIAMASDIRIGTRSSRVGFLFTKVGLSGADMGACAMLPRIIGAGRAAELLFTGRFMNAEEAERWGFYNRLVNSNELEGEALNFARSLATGPSFAHVVTKACLNQEWSMPIETALANEAAAQALCMTTADFERAYDAFVGKKEVEFKGD